MATTQHLIDELQRKARIAALAVKPETAVPVEAPLVEDTTPLSIAKGEQYRTVAQPTPITSPVAPAVQAPVAEAPKEGLAGTDQSPEAVHAATRAARDAYLAQSVAPEQVAPTNYFYDMLLQNEEFRKKASDAYERNEKSNRARSTIASVADALSSLGNLVGTTYGAFNQPQTYQTPFINEQKEADRAYYRQLANRLQQNEQSIRLAEARDAAADRSLDRQLAVQQAITDRAAMNNQNKLDLEDKRQEGKMEIEKLKQDGRVSLKQMDIDYKENKDALQAALRQQGINVSRGRLSEMIRHNQTIEKIREKGGGGGVGGYETVIIRDEFGREIKRRRVPLGATVDLDEEDNAPWSTGASGGDNAPWA